MPSPFVPITVSVPEDRVRDLLAFATQLAGNSANGAVSPPSSSVSSIDPRSSSTDSEGHKIRARNGFSRNAVRNAYTGGVSDYWRPFLEMLANKPDEWTSWKELYEGLGLTNRQAAGMLGAAERRCKGKPPYEKTWDDVDYWFLMPAEVADIVRELASQAQ